MKKAKRIVSTMLTVALVLGLFAATPMLASAEALPDLDVGTWAGNGSNPGDGHRYIDMGSYNGHELIWRVLDVYVSDGTDGNAAGSKTALLLLDDLLRTPSGDIELRAFDSNGDSSGNWARPSEIKTFLNGAFYNSAFNPSEQANIITANYNMGGPCEGNYGFPATDSSKVFMLSIDEANNHAFFANNNDRNIANYTWWLRSPGFNERLAMYVKYGEVSDFGDIVNDNGVGVCPAMKINLSSEIFTPITYIVTFTDWDGTVLDTQEVEIGTAAIAPDDPVRPGFHFTGWHTGSGTKWDFDNPVTSDMTLYAQWETHDYVGVGSAPATCISMGEVTYTCAHCGDVKILTIPMDPTNHVGGTYEAVITPATFEAEGLMGTYCGGCGELLSTRVIDKLTEEHAAEYSIGFIGYYDYDFGNGPVKLSTSFYWQTVKAGEPIDWDAVFAAYDAWESVGGYGLAGLQGWQTSGTFSHYYGEAAPYVVINETLKAAYLENYYGAVYFAPVSQR